LHARNPSLIAAAAITANAIITSFQPKPFGRNDGSRGGSTEISVTYPDEPLHAARTKMLTRDIGRLPVVERNEPTRTVGYLGRAALLSARMRLHEEENIRQRC
jgi:CBS domain-containing protein